MEAEKKGGKVGGEEDVEEVGKRVVVVSGEGVGGWKGVLPSGVVGCERGVRRVDF